MAATANERFKWSPVINFGALKQQYARVSLFDSDTAVPLSDPSVNRLITDVNGQVNSGTPLQIIKNVHDVGVSADAKTPHVLRVVALLTSGEGNFGAGIYGARVLDLPKEIVGDSVDGYFLTADPYIVNDRTAIAAYVGIGYTHGSDLITISASTDAQLSKINEYTLYNMWLDPQKTPGVIMFTGDGLNYTCEYDITVNAGVTLDGQGRTLVMGTGKTVTFATTANFSNGLGVNGDVSWGTQDITGLTVVNGALDFTAAGTYNLSGCTIAEVTNSSGGAVTINASVDTTITLNTGPNITIIQSVTHTLTGVVNNSEVTYTKLEDPATETGTAGATANATRTFTDSTKSWVTNAYKGMLLKIEEGTQAGRYYIVGNNATQLTVDAEFDASESALNYSIYDETNSTVEFHVENVTGNQTDFLYNYAPGYVVDILVFNTLYEDIALLDVTLGSTDASVPIQQILSLFYQNP